MVKQMQQKASAPEPQQLVSDCTMQMRCSGGQREEEKEKLGLHLRDRKNLQADHQKTAEYLEGLHTWQDGVVNPPPSLVHINMRVSVCTLPSLARQDNLDLEQRLPHGYIFILLLILGSEKQTKIYKQKSSSEARDCFLSLPSFQSSLSSIYLVSKDSLKKTVHLLFSYGVEKRYGQIPVC